MPTPTLYRGAVLCGAANPPALDGLRAALIVYQPDGVLDEMVDELDKTWFSQTGEV